MANDDIELLELEAAAKEKEKKLANQNTPSNQGSPSDAIPSWWDIAKSPVNLVTQGIPGALSLAADAVEGAGSLAFGHDYITGEDKNRVDVVRNGLRNTRDLAAAGTMIPGAVTAFRSLSEDNYTPQQARQDLKGELAGAPLNALLMTGGAKFLENQAKAVSENALNETVGYNRQAKQGSPVPVDENLNPVGVQEATAQASKKDLKIQDLIKGGYPDTISIRDGRQAASLKLQQFKDSAGKQIGGIVENSIPVEQSHLSSLAPWEAEEYLNANSPTWEASQDFLDGITQTNPTEGANLQSKYDAIKAAWETSDKSLAAFKELQENLGLSKQASFIPSSAKESFGITLDNLMYSDIAQSLENRISTLGKLQGDIQLGDKFATANKSFSAAATFTDDAFNASRLSLSTKLKNNFWKTAGNPLSNLAPNQLMKSANAIKDLMNLTSRVPIANPLIDIGQAVIPRNWDEVKQRPQISSAIAARAGIPVSAYNMLPESTQQDIHKMIVLQNPNSATTVPGNYNIVNNEFINPEEKDAITRQMLDKSPSERAKVIGFGTLQNKFIPVESGSSSSVNLKPQIDMNQVNSSLSDVFNKPQQDASYNQESSSKIDQLMKITSIHNQDNEPSNLVH